MISLSLRVKPELGFTSFRTVLQCHLTDKASSRHPTKKNNVPTPTPAPRSQFPPSCPLPHPQHLSPYCMLYIYLYNVWQMLFSKMATRFPIPRTFFYNMIFLLPTLRDVLHTHWIKPGLWLWWKWYYLTSEVRSQKAAQPQPGPLGARDLGTQPLWYEEAQATWKGQQPAVLAISPSCSPSQQPTNF